MHIGLVVPGDPETATGGFVYDRQVAEHLRQGADVVDVIELPGGTYVGRLAGNLDPRVASRLDRSVDLLLEDELCHPSLLRDHRPAVPAVSLVHHLRSSEPGRSTRLYRSLERRYLNGVDAVVCSSRATRRAVDSLAGSLPGLVAHPGGDRFDPGMTPAAVSRRAHQPGPLNLVFLGRVTPRKGLHALVEGLSRLPPERWRLVAIGDLQADPRYVRHVRQLIDGAGVSGSVELAGRLPDAAVAATLEGSHVLAVPSSYEGFGIAYLEGMGFGLPAIATTEGGAREVVTPGETGWLVPPDDPAAVAGAVASVLDDRERLARLGCAALERYEAAPGWAEVAERIGAFLERVQRDAVRGHRPAES